LRSCAGSAKVAQGASVLVQRIAPEPVEPVIDLN
jgi:hypothetical protein